jgi:hypothetical protein
MEIDMVDPNSTNDDLVAFWETLAGTPDAADQLDALRARNLSEDDFFELDLAASNTRAGSGHEEDPDNDPRPCDICRPFVVENPDGVNLYFHPLFASERLDEEALIDAQAKEFPGDE